MVLVVVRVMHWIEARYVDVAGDWIDGDVDRTIIGIDHVEVCDWGSHFTGLKSSSCASSEHIAFQVSAVTAKSLQYRHKHLVRGVPCLWPSVETDRGRSDVLLKYLNRSPNSGAHRVVYVGHSFASWKPI